MVEPYFGVIAAGRALQTNFLQAGENQFVVEIPNAETVNHIVVFLTGIQLFPEQYGGSVYMRWPGEQDEVSWHYLGFIMNAKPSAIFKISQLANMKSDQSDSLFGQPALNVGSAMLGVMIEELSVIESKVAAEGTAASTQASINQFAEKMVSNLVNYLTSFVVTLPDPSNYQAASEYIPVKAVRTWYETFGRRMEQNPNFWKFL